MCTGGGEVSVHVYTYIHVNKMRQYTIYSYTQCNTSRAWLGVLLQFLRDLSKQTHLS